jgi:uncharacterized protein (TIGR04255 family)
VTLDFGAHPDVVFRRAPLVVVLSQVRFAPILSLLTAAGVAGFQEALRERYPTLTPEEGGEVQLGPTGLSLSEKPPVWRLTSQDEHWRVSVATDFVALEAFKYTDAIEFAERLDEVLEAVDRTVHPPPASRVGLRKVNDLEHPEVHAPRDWRGRIGSHLLGLLEWDRIPGDVEFAFSDVRLRDGDGGTLAIRHGVLPGAPAKYRLDLDYFTERSLSVEAGGRLTAMLREYSDAMTGFFHLCLTEGLYDWLEPRPRGERLDGDRAS